MRVTGRHTAFVLACALAGCARISRLHSSEPRDLSLTHSVFAEGLQPAPAALAGIVPMPAARRASASTTDGGYIGGDGDPGDGNTDGGNIDDDGGSCSVGTPITEVVDLELSRICTWHGEPWKFFMEAERPLLTIETGPLPVWFDSSADDRCAAAVSPDGAVPVYQLSNGWDFLYSTNSGEGAPSFQPQEMAFSVFPNSNVCEQPLYRCRYGGGHYLSNQPACEGFIEEGRLGYVCREPSSTTQPIYRLVGPNGAHAVVARWSQAQALIGMGWKYEGVLGYAPVAARGEDNNVVLARIDLGNKDMVSKKFTTSLVVDFAPLKEIYPNDWMDRPLRMKVCDDVEGIGSCNYAPRGRTISPASLYFLPRDLPKTLKLEIFLWPIPDYRPEYYATLPSFCERLISPLLMSLNGQAIRLTGPADGGVKFDLEANGIPILTGWTNDDETAFLVRDLNGNGNIDNGAELFGSATALRDGSLAANGFEALKSWAVLPQGGLLTAINPLWSDLRLWTDANHDGLAERGELYTLDELGIVSIDLNYINLREADHYGNETRQRSQFTRRVNDRLIASVILDVWFHTYASY